MSILKWFITDQIHVFLHIGLLLPLCYEWSYKDGVSNHYTHYLIVLTGKTLDCNK